AYRRGWRQRLASRAVPDPETNRQRQIDFAVRRWRHWLGWGPGDGEAAAPGEVVADFDADPAALARGIFERLLRDWLLERAELHWFSDPVLFRLELADV